MHKLISHDNGFLDMSMSVSSNVQLVLVAYMFCSLRQLACDTIIQYPLIVLRFILG